jgi:hypothetical protein
MGPVSRRIKRRANDIETAGFGPPLSFYARKRGESANPDATPGPKAAPLTFESLRIKPHRPQFHGGATPVTQVSRSEQRTGHDEE